MKDDMPNLRNSIRKLERARAAREAAKAPAVARLLISGNIQKKRCKEPPDAP